MITVNWKYISGNEDEKWDWCRVLYMYLAPKEGEPIYIGQAYECSVRERFLTAGKAALWGYMKKLKVMRHAIAVGNIIIPRGQNISKELVNDIESLLIYHTLPCGNIMSKDTRISRPGMKIRCGGDWPLPQKTFEDWEEKSEI